MALHILTPLFLRVLDMRELLHLFHASGRVIIVDIGIVARKTLGAEQLFVIKRSVCFAELCMPLVGYFPQAIISWHGILLYTILFRNTPMPSISSSMMSPRRNQGCTSVPSSSRQPVPTVPEPSTSPARRRALREAQAIIRGKL